MLEKAAEQAATGLSQATEIAALVAEKLTENIGAGLTATALEKLAHRALEQITDATGLAAAGRARLLAQDPHDNRGKQGHQLMDLIAL